MNQCFAPIQQIQEYIGKELNGFQVSYLLFVGYSENFLYHICLNVLLILSCFLLFYPIFV